MIQNLSSSLSLTNSISGRESTLGATQEEEEEEEEGTLRGSLAFLKCRFLNEFERKLLSAHSVFSCFGSLEKWRSKTNKFVNRERREGQREIAENRALAKEEEEGTLRGSRVLPERRPLTNTFCVLGFRSLERVKQ